VFGGYDVIDMRVVEKLRVVPILLLQGSSLGYVQRFLEGNLKKKYFGRNRRIVAIFGRFV